MEQRIIKYLIIFLSIVFILSFIGLFYLFILPNFVFYCPNANEDTVIQVGCLIAYPEKYEDKFIKVVGKYRSGSAIWTITSEFGEYKINISGTIQGASASFGLTRAYLDFSIVNETNDTALIVNNEYYWYGTFRYTNHVRSSNGENYARGMYLEVSKIEEL